MSGRAGRRGLDDKGIVILMVDQKMSPGACKNIVKVTVVCEVFVLIYGCVISNLRLIDVLHMF